MHSAIQQLEETLLSLGWAPIRESETQSDRDPLTHWIAPSNDRVVIEVKECVRYTGTSGEVEKPARLRVGDRVWVCPGGGGEPFSGVVTEVNDEDQGDFEYYVENPVTKRASFWPRENLVLKRAN